MIPSPFNCILLVNVLLITHHFRVTAERVAFFDFGQRFGDESLKRGDVYKELKLQTPIFENINSIFINENGIIGLGQYVPRALLPSKEKFIAVYHKNTVVTDSSEISFRETNDTKILSEIKRFIRTIFDRSFEPTQVIIVTFNEISDPIDLDKRLKYQAVITSNSKDVYLQLNFERLEISGATSGYSLDYNCKFGSFAPVTTSEQLHATSNVGKTGLHMFHLTREGCSHADFYKHGETAGDKFFPRTDDGFVNIKLKNKMPLFSSKQSELFISVNGVITNERPPSTFIQRQIPNKNHSFISILSVDMDIRNTGTISYRETYDRQTLTWASKQISRFTWRTFIVKQAVIVTFLGVPVKHSHHLMSFQAMLAANGEDTYMIADYKWHAGIHDMAVMGYSNKLCDWNWFKGNGDSMKSTFLYTNTGYVGQYIYPVSSKRCMDDVFFPHGVSRGDSLVRKGDDSAIAFTLQRPFPFFTKKYRVLYVSVNSILSVNKPTSYSSEKLFLDNTLLVAMLRDFSIKDGGLIYYGETTDEKQLYLYSQRIKEKISKEVAVTHAIIITYINIQEVGVESSRYTFQLVIANTKNGLYGITNYFKLAADGGATSGYVDLVCKIAKNLPIPTKTEVETKNVSFVFQISQCEDYISELFPYGTAQDKEMGKSDTYKKVDLSKPIRFFNEMHNSIYIGANGVISFEKPVIEDQISIPYDATPVFAVYSTKMTQLQNGSHIYYQQTNNKSLIWRIFRMTSFKPDYAVIITYVNLESTQRPEFKNTFQIIFAYDKNSTYGITIYEQLDSQDATVGYSVPGCTWRLMSSLGMSGSMMSSSTNIKKMGVHVYALHLEECSQYQGFYSYGKYAGDRTMPIGEKSTKVNLLNPMPFLGLKIANALWVSDSGIISMFELTWNRVSVRYLRRYDVFAVFGTPYFDLELGGEIFTRATVDQKVLSKINADIIRQTQKTFKATSAMIATYILVPTRGGEKNTFQVAIATDQIQTFAIANYGQLELPYSTINVSDRVCRRMDLTVANSDSLLSGGYHGQHVIQLTPYKNCRMRVYPTLMPTTTTTKSLEGNTFPKLSTSPTTKTTRIRSETIFTKATNPEPTDTGTTKPARSSSITPWISTNTTLRPSTTSKTTNSIRIPINTFTAATPPPRSSSTTKSWNSTNTTQQSSTTSKTTTISICNSTLSPVNPTKVTTITSTTTNATKKSTTSPTNPTKVSINTTIATPTLNVNTTTFTTVKSFPVNSTTISPFTQTSSKNNNSFTEKPTRPTSKLSPGSVTTPSSSKKSTKASVMTGFSLVTAKQPSTTSSRTIFTITLDSFTPKKQSVKPTGFSSKLSSQYTNAKNVAQTTLTSTPVSSFQGSTTSKLYEHEQKERKEEEEREAKEEKEEEGNEHENEANPYIPGVGGGQSSNDKNKENEEKSFYLEGIIIGSLILGIPLVILVIYIILRYRNTKKEKRGIKNREKRSFLAANNDVEMESLKNMY